MPDDALAAQDVKSAALTRVFGFEVLPAPFVVAHLQLGLLLAKLGAPIANGERVAVYLTNSLTGWTSEGAQVSLSYPELEKEREAARSVKHHPTILVVLGNPPYYPFGGVNSEEEAGLIEAYKHGISTKHSLNDLYVRFYSVAQRRIVDGTGYGIVCFISHYSYLHEPGFAQMRRTLLEDFDEIFIDCLNGDSRETGKQAPDGLPDPSIFSSVFNKQGIQVGTAIGTYVRHREHRPAETVHYRDFWGEDKKRQLLASSRSGDPSRDYQPLPLTDINHRAFRPARISIQYEDWPQIIEFAASAPGLGLNENRGSTLVDPDRVRLMDRMRTYLNPVLRLADLKGTDAEPLTHKWARFDPLRTRSAMLATGGFNESCVVKFLSRPLDVQWAYVDVTHKLWNEVRSKELVPHAKQGNRFLLVRRRAPRADDGAPFLPASCLGDQHTLHKDAYFVPFVTYPIDDDGFSLSVEEPAINLSAKARAYMASLDVADTDEDYVSILWWHSLAIAYSSDYVNENAGGVSADWPRIPLPATADRLRASAKLGRQLATLLDPLQPLLADSSLPIVAAVGPVRRSDGKAAQPERGDLTVRMHWGVVQGTAVFPGHGKVVAREYTETRSQRAGRCRRGAWVGAGYLHQ